MDLFQTIMYWLILGLFILLIAKLIDKLKLTKMFVDNNLDYLAIPLGMIVGILLHEIILWLIMS